MAGAEAVSHNQPQPARASEINSVLWQAAPAPRLVWCEFFIHLLGFVVRFAGLINVYCSQQVDGKSMKETATDEKNTTTSTSAAAMTTTTTTQHTIHTFHTRTLVALWCAALNTGSS